MKGQRFQTAVKALLLLGLALFLYTRLAGGTLYYYINERFATYTLLAVVGLVLVAVSYRPFGRRRPDPSTTHDSAPSEHNHRLTFAGGLLVALPILLGVLVPPQPLGAAALSNREVNVTMAASALPAAVRAAAEKHASEKNVLDWLHSFAGAPDAATTFAGEPANVVGFVFRDERFGEDRFMVTRFVVSCCVADANVAGMVVRWPGAAELEADQWVEVRGVLEPGQFDGQTVPTLAAQSVTPVEVPQQPYLYP
jgi:putative membrane protein